MRRWTISTGKAVKLNLASEEGRAQRREQLAQRDQHNADYIADLRKRLARGEGWSQNYRWHRGKR